MVVPKAVGSSRSKSKFLITPVSGQHRLSMIRNKDERIIGEIEVEVDTLDNIVSSLDVDRVDLLKLDIEGAELEALKGAEESLKITRNIAMELHYDGEDEEVRKFLEERFDIKVIGSMLYATNTSIQ